MPTFDVRLSTPVLLSVTAVEAKDERQARWDMAEMFRAWAANLTGDDFTATRQPPLPDDVGDVRSEARYEQTPLDDETERRERERWGTTSQADRFEHTEDVP